MPPRSNEPSFDLPPACQGSPKRLHHAAHTGSMGQDRPNPPAKTRSPHGAEARLKNTTCITSRPIRRACSTRGIFAGSATLRSKTPFIVRLLFWMCDCHRPNSLLRNPRFGEGVGGAGVSAVVSNTLKTSPTTADGSLSCLKPVSCSATRSGISKIKSTPALMPPASICLRSISAQTDAQQSGGEPSISSPLGPPLPSW